MEHLVQKGEVTNYEKSFEDRVNEEVRRRLSGVDVKVNARVELLEDDLGHVR